MKISNDNTSRVVFEYDGAAGGTMSASEGTASPSALQRLQELPTEWRTVGRSFMHRGDCADELEPLVAALAAEQAQLHQENERLEASNHKWLIDFGMVCKSKEAAEARLESAEAALEEGRTVMRAVLLQRDALQERLENAEADRDTLRRALEMLVGSSDRAELEEMEGVLRAAQAPDADKAAAINGIHALLALTAPVPPATESPR